LPPLLFAQTSPGGVSSDLNYWLKADAGVTLTNGQVSQWDNQTSTAGNINQTSNARQPEFTANALNFNPAITFNVAGNDFDFLNTDDLVWDSDTVILVFNPNQDSSSRGTLQAVLVYIILVVMPVLELVRFQLLQATTFLTPLTLFLIKVENTLQLLVLVKIPRETPY